MAHHDKSHQPHSAAGHSLTTDDMNLPKIVVVGVASLAIFAAGIVWAYVLMVRQEAEIRGAGPARVPDKVGSAEIGIVDQTPFEKDKRLTRWRAEKKRALGSWGWVNRQEGIAHIPIDKAMEWVVREPPDIPGEGVPPVVGTPPAPEPEPAPPPPPPRGKKR
jgi:hypothetical protein